MDTEQRIQAKQEQRDKISHNAHRSIWISFQCEGIHAYPAAGEDENLKDVSFLAYPHRHIFHFKVAIEVFHNDRDIEFIQVKRWIGELYGEGILQLDNKSCEMISDDLYNHIANKYPERDITISVSEDNENGSEITYRRIRLEFK